MQCSARPGVPTPLRFYKREWTRYRPHLPKSVSLPIFKLLPNDRPIFTCLQCGFINTLIPLCLWCSWTSEAAQREFERSTPRARRASMPSKIVRTLDQRGMINVISEPIEHRSDRYSTRLAEDLTLRRVSQEQDQDCLSNKSLSQMKSHLLRYHWDRSLFKASKETVTDLYVANATSADILIRRSCTPISERYSSQDSDSLSEEPQRPSWPGSSRRESLFSSVNFPSPFHKLCNSLSTGVDRRASMHLIKTISTKSLRSAPIVIDFETLAESHVSLEPIVGDYDKPVVQVPRTPKTLRRRKRLSFYRRSTYRPDSSASSTFNSSSLTVVSRRQSICTGDDYLSNLGYETRPQSQAHADSCLQLTNTTRLGHPSRPLYTAIRPHMFPVKLTNDTSTHSQSSQIPHPSRPKSLPTPQKAPAPGVMSVLLSTSALDNDGVSIEPLNYQSRLLSRHIHGSALPSAFGLTSQRDPTGFSLSGETELRMALAKAGDGGSHNGFRFKDMRKRCDIFNVIERLRELKKGFKDLILRRHRC